MLSSRIAALVGIATAALTSGCIFGEGGLSFSDDAGRIDRGIAIVDSSGADATSDAAKGDTAGPDAAATDAAGRDSAKADAPRADANLDGVAATDISVDSTPPADSTVDTQPPADSTVDAQPPADSTVDTRPAADSTVDQRVLADCRVKYASVPGFRHCSDNATSCAFYFDPPSTTRSCDEMCKLGGGTCVGAAAEDNNSCRSSYSTSCSFKHGDGLCRCTR